MKPKAFVTIAVIGGALYLVYVYLRKSGTWDKWFAPAIGGNEFTDEAALLAYCNLQNLALDDGGLAVFVDSTGTRHSDTCANWIRSQGKAGMASVAASHPGVDPAVLEKLRAAAASSPILGCDRANVDQWNLLLQELDPTAQTSDLASAGVQRGQNDVMNALTYLSLRCQCGLSQVAPPDIAFHNPMSWVN
ncbi:MAG: hypothetical protein IVW54_16550 [Candidatus Binataceae bacterium]|nr:hypothetical protein [Candidatus Binataceae bacterium]